MTTANSFKDQGNSFYTKGKYEDAEKQYTKGIELLNTATTIEEKKLLSILYCNRAMSNIQLKNYELALEDAKQSISSYNQFPKAYLRAGDAYLALKKYREAKEMYLTCIRYITSSEPTLLEQATNALQNAKMKLFYEPILESRPDMYGKVEIKYLDSVKEKALFAKQDIKQGEIVFSDEPFIHHISNDSFIKHSDSICFHCIKFIQPVDPAVKCPNHSICKYQFCSEKCMESSTMYHSQACNQNDLDIVNQYRVSIATAPTCTQLLLAERLVSMISYLLKTKKAKNCNLALGSITHLKRGSLMKQQPSFNGSNLDQLQQQYTPLLNILKETYGLKTKEELENQLLVDEFNKLFSVDFFDNLLGMINFNSTSTVVKSPNQEINNNNNSSNGNNNKNKNKKNSNNNSNKVEISSWGVGLFPIFSCMNHSCSPNIEITNEIIDGVDSVKMVVKAKKNIPMGTEIFHSYCDENLPIKQRQSILSHQYGFKCQCLKCKK
ncbi:hypothetical protein CYY_003888 [Polysphondylium violaceum]|uniref:SET domain-containing protein n=1 Tax=Polysphondylium violaceum TaxID=133409 RepID=A0A8J4PXT9_9MYCE|nr:hypothetical protein CYY_003888 [Polysphondylium violaceum]